MREIDSAMESPRTWDRGTLDRARAMPSSDLAGPATDRTERAMTNIMTAKTLDFGVLWELDDVDLHF